MSKPLVQSTGRRKRAVARVRVRAGSGQVVVNGRAMDDYFPSRTHRMQVLEPMKLTETAEVYDVDITLHGGGPTGQAGAVRMGIARALIVLDAELLDTKPAEAVRRSVRGMLPKNRLGRQMLKKLKVYAGPNHPHGAQLPKALPIEHARRSA